MPVLIALLLSLFVSGVFGQTTTGFSKTAPENADWKEIIRLLNAMDSGQLHPTVTILPEKMICRRRIDFLVIVATGVPVVWEPVTGNPTNTSILPVEEIKDAQGTDALELMLKTPGQAIYQHGYPRIPDKNGAPLSMESLSARMIVRYLIRHY